jgi:hypothetical protein
MVSIILMGCAAMTAFLVEPAASQERSDLAISPRVLKVTAFFAGSRVTISGKIPSSHDAVVEIIGPETSGLYDVKGRLGPFWMNREKIQLEKVPCLYILLLPEGQGWGRKTGDLGMGLEHLKSVIFVNHDGAIPDDVFRMFVNLKSSEGLYGEKPGAVSYQRAENGLKGFTAVYTFPSSTAGGRYEVKVTTLEKDTPGQVMTGGFVVKEIGFIKFIHDLASKQSLFYGIFSVLIALFAGALIGLLFKQRGRGH